MTCPDCDLFLVCDQADCQETLKRHLDGCGPNSIQLKNLEENKRQAEQRLRSINLNSLEPLPPVQQSQSQTLPDNQLQLEGGCQEFWRLLASELRPRGGQDWSWRLHQTGSCRSLEVSFGALHDLCQYLLYGGVGGEPLTDFARAHAEILPDCVALLFIASKRQVFRPPNTKPPNHPPTLPPSHHHRLPPPTSPALNFQPFDSVLFYSYLCLAVGPPFSPLLAFTTNPDSRPQNLDFYSRKATELAELIVPLNIGAVATLREVQVPAPAHKVPFLLTPATTPRACSQSAAPHPSHCGTRTLRRSEATVPI